MPEIKRGRFSISVNILMTTSLITRALTLGFVLLSIYIKTGDKLLNDRVVKVTNIYEINGIPYGTAVYCLVFSLIGVFVLDVMTGIFGLYGAIRKNRYMLVVNSAMSFLLIIVYIIYIVLFAIVYDERISLRKKLYWYTVAYRNNYLSWMYQSTIFAQFTYHLGCTLFWSGYECADVYNEKLTSYIQTYFGLIVTCITCQVVSIVAVEYLYRKMELKQSNERISNKKYWILFSLRHGILRSCFIFIVDSFKKSKKNFISVIIKLASLVMGLGLLGLGLTIIGHEFITNYQLRDLFYRLQFYNLYLYDIITGFAASSTVLGIATVVISLLSLLGSWRKSQILLCTSIVLSLLVQIPRIMAVLIWIVFQDKINAELQLQLTILQSGYYSLGYANDATTEWNIMIQTLNCCGVNVTSDTFYYSDYPERRKIFCYENAIESVAYPSETYDNTNKITNVYPYSTGNFRTTTCSSKLLLRIQMIIGWFLAITIMQFLLEVASIIFINRELENCNETVLDKREAKRENVNATEEKVKHIMLLLMVGVAKFWRNTWNTSKLTFLALSSDTVLFLLNVGLLIIALAVRYDGVFGNRYINDYIFDDIVIAGRSFSSLTENFHIVVTTFSLASFCVGIYAFIASAVDFKQRCFLLFLVILFMGFLFIAHGIQIVLWGIVHSHGQCCGVESYTQSFQSTNWWSERLSATIPIYCCKSETILYPYTSRSSSNTDCTDTMTIGTFHDLVCDEAIKTKLYEYSISFFVISAFALLAEIICIITTSFNIYYLKKEQRIKPAEDLTNEKKEEKITDITVGDDPINSTVVNKDENEKEITDFTVIDDPIISQQVNTDEDEKKRSRKKKRKPTMESLPPIKEKSNHNSSRKMIVDDINENNSDQPAQETIMKEADHDLSVNQLDSYSLNETLIAERHNENKMSYISYNKLVDEHVYKTAINMEMSYTKPGDDQRLETKFEDHPDESSL